MKQKLLWNIKKDCTKAGSGRQFPFPLSKLRITLFQYDYFLVLSVLLHISHLKDALYVHVLDT